jgi:hypothetical protein
MGLPKNRTNNPAGRPKGSPNRNTDEVRVMLRTFVAMNLQTIQNDFESLEPKDRLFFIEKLLRHVLPPPLETTAWDVPTDVLCNLLQQAYDEAEK